jgi:SMP-30/Gluconolactonase/LRE-like region/NHL repeat
VNNRQDRADLNLGNGTRKVLQVPPRRSRFIILRIALLALSFIATVICACAAAAHYRESAWGDVWQPIGWLLSMSFLLLAFLPDLRELTFRFKSLIAPKTAFFLFWVLIFVVSHLWNFRTAPWNGNALFDESGWDLWYLKTYVIGHAYQPAWFHAPISRETLFHYYVWGFLKLFGFNILSYQGALFVIWLTIFLFTLLLVDLFFESYVVTSVTALIFNFLPFAFIYTFAGYRYPMATALAVVSLYFMHLGFRTSSRFCLSLSGIAAGLCLASSISGKQYLLTLLIAGPLYGAFHWNGLMQQNTWKSLALIVFGFAAAGTPILLYIVFNRGAYTLYESNFVRDFWHAMQTGPLLSGIRPYIEQCRSCFFSVPAQRFIIPDTLPIPLPYYWLLLPGLALAVWQKRFEIPLLALIPVVGAFIATCIENRLLMPIPFWVILMSFTVAGIVKLKRWPGVQIVLGMLAGLILLDGLVPSVRYIYAKTKSPFSIHHYAQYEVAVSRFLKTVVAGEEHPDPPRLERDEFNRIKGISDPPYDTFICPRDAYSIIHLFLHDYDDSKVLSLCSGTPFYVMPEQEVWNANKRTILKYIPTKKDLKLIWESDPQTQRIIRMFQSLRSLGTEDSISFTLGGGVRSFYVLNIPNKNIHQFQQRVGALPATPNRPPSALSALPEGVSNMFEGGKGIDKGQFDSPSGICLDGDGNVLVADTGNGRIQKFSPTGTFLSTLRTKENGRGQLAEPNGIAVDRTGNVYVAEAGNHRVRKLAPDGTLIAEWKGPEPGFYGPRRIAIGSDDSIYVVDQGHTRIVKLNPDGRVLFVWGSKGTGDGQFDDPTSVAVDLTTNKVYVADPMNKRIQVFDSNKQFLAKWLIPEWGQPHGFEDLAIDSEAGRLYASSAHMDAVLVFDLNGNRMDSVRPHPPRKIEGASALVIADKELYVLCTASNHVVKIRP